MTTAFKTILLFTSIMMYGLTTNTSDQVFFNDFANYDSSDKSLYSSNDTILCLKQLLAHCKNEHQYGNYLLIDSLLDITIGSIGENEIQNFYQNHSCEILELFILSGSTKLKIGNLENGKKRLENAQQGLESMPICDISKRYFASVILRNFGNYYLFKGKNDLAYQKYIQALKLCEGDSIKDLENKAACLQNLGIAYTELGKIVLAEESFLKSLELKKRLFGPNNPQLGRAYLNFGNFLIETHKLDEAYRYVNKAEKIFTSSSIKETSYLAKALLLKGKIYYTNWDYEKAILYKIKALSVYENLGLMNENLFSNYLNIGICYQWLGDYELAFHFYYKSIKHYFPEITKAYRNLAGLHALVDNSDSARYYYDLALNHAKKIGEPSDISLTYNHYGKFLISIGTEYQGQEYLMKSLQISKDLYADHNPALLYYLYDIGNYFYQCQKYDSAIHYMEKCFPILNYTLNDPDPNGYGINFSQDQQRKFMVTGLMAQIQYELFEESGDIQQLYKSYEQALETITEIDKNLSIYNKESSYLFTREKIYTYYDDFVNITQTLFEHTNDSTLLNSLNEGIERSKAAYFRSVLQTKKAFFAGQVPDSLIQELKNIDLLIAKFEHLQQVRIKSSGFQFDSENNYIDTIFRLNILKDKISQYLDENYHSYQELRHLPNIISFEDLQTKLSEDEVVINYFYTESEITMLVIAKKQLKLIRKKTDSIESRLDHYLSHFTFKRILFNDSASKQDFANTSRELHELLIEPIGKTINAKRLIIIPYHKLSYIPFETLISDHPADPYNYSGQNYLMHENSISYAPSATLLYEYFKNPASTGKVPMVLAIAPDYTNYWEDESNEVVRDKTFKALPGALSEVEKIADYFPVKSQVDEQATEENFKDKANDFEILHFAMHALIDQKNPLFSKLVFQKDPESIEDGFLNTYEIYSLDLKGDLVVLSSCKTGTGKLQQGEGVITLSRAFQVAGMPSVIATLWDIEDKCSSDIMKNFYRHLAEGYGKDVALQRAKMDFLSSAEELYTHPWFWAGYTLIGDNSPVESPEIRLRVPEGVRYAILSLLLAFILLSVILGSRKQWIKR